MSHPPITLQQLNAMTQAAFTNALGGLFEHSPWIAEQTWLRRPFVSTTGLLEALNATLDQAPAEARLKLILAHPELTGRAAQRGELTAASAQEQTGAGLDQCSPEQLARLQQLNQQYRDRFGFPFILAVRGHRRDSILERLAERLSQPREQELREALVQIQCIARWRLLDRMGVSESPYGTGD